MNLAWATLDDAAALSAAHARAFPAPWSAQAMRELLEGPGVFGFLAIDETPAGLVLCRVGAGEMEVLTLGTAPELRRRGLARGLMTAALGAARQAGAEAAFLEVAVDNAPACALYASLGFRRAGVRRGYYDRGAEGRVDALVMRLDLGAASA